MALDLDADPKGFMTILVAAGLLIFRPGVQSPKEAFKTADEFVDEAERRFGRLNP